MYGVRPSCIAWATLLLLLSTLGSMSAPDYDAELATTLIRGMDHRASRLSTFRGIVSVIHWVGLPRDGADEERRWHCESAELRYYAVDRTGHRWLVERRECLPDNATEQLGLPWWANALEGGLRATALAWETDWSIMPSDNPGYRQDAQSFGSHATLILNYAAKTWHDSFAAQHIRSLRQEQLDQAPCFRIDAGREFSTPGATFDSMTWIDVEAGFAVRRWLHLYSNDGQVSTQHVGQANGFREYGNALWLPEQVLVARCTADPQSGWRFDHLWRFTTICGVVNGELSNSELGNVQWEHPQCPVRYDWRLREDRSLLECMLSRPTAGEMKWAETVDPASAIETMMTEIVNDARDGADEAAEKVCLFRKLPQ